MMQAYVSSATQNEMIKKISQNPSGISSLHLGIIGSASVASKQDFLPVLVFGEERVHVRRPLMFFFFFFRSLFSRLTYSLSSTVLSLVAEAGV